MACTVIQTASFLSTLSLRRATYRNAVGPGRHQNFYPRSPCGERHGRERKHNRYYRFLSTLSLRRATMDVLMLFMVISYFYPRSPCGERRTISDGLYPATAISIHALLAESDSVTCGRYCKRYYFYPRSPCGERPAGNKAGAESFKNFYPRSPCGERPDRRNLANNLMAFLSTLSLRRATLMWYQCNTVVKDFYPRSPCGERLKYCLHAAHLLIFLSTLSLRRATYRNAVGPGRHQNFYPRSPCGERPGVQDHGGRVI